MRRMSKRKHTSPVWEHFVVREDGRIVCNLCNNDFANGGGTSNLQKHLRGKHTEEAKKWFGEIESDGKKQTLISTFGVSRNCPPAHEKRITELIAEMVARDLRPLSMVEGEGFKQLRQIELNYKVPSRPHIKSICQN